MTDRPDMPPDITKTDDGVWEWTAEVLGITKRFTSKIQDRDGVCGVYTEGDDIGMWEPLPDSAEHPASDVSA